MQFVEQARQSVSAWISEHPYVTAGVVTIATAHILCKVFKRDSELGIVPAPPDTVVLYQLSRGPYTPSLTPFAVKLESYLRLAKIPYQNDHNTKRSSKGKFPWISYNGEAVADSQLSIEYLNSKLGVDLNKGLTAEERARAHMVRILVDEHLYWCLLYFRWVYGGYPNDLALITPKYILLPVKRELTKQVHGQGIGRHSTEEVKQIMLQDLGALSVYLGDKQFIMGDNPTEVDCAVFGLLSFFVYNAHDDITKGFVKEQFPSLYRYTLRMKETVWPDWDQCITHGGTVKATK